VRLTVVPIGWDEACEFIRQHHRHHQPSLRGKAYFAVADEQGKVRGVAVIGRPVARMLQDGWTLEVTRVATDGCPNACSALYGAARRVAFALGYRRLVTYTLKSESGTSLRAAGWKVVGEVEGRSWTTPSRPRVDKSEAQRQDKFRWEVSA
jgi:hypothetical protein